MLNTIYGQSVNGIDNAILVAVIAVGTCYCVQYWRAHTDLENFLSKLPPHVHDYFSALNLHSK